MVKKTSTNKPVKNLTREEFSTFMRNLAEFFRVRLSLTDEGMVRYLSGRIENGTGVLIR